MDSVFLDKLMKHCDTMTEKPTSNLFETAESSRILLELHCEAASETLEEEVSAMTLRKKYFDYANVNDDGALHYKNLDKFTTSNNSAEWTTNFKNLDLSKYLNPPVSNIEEEFDAFHKIFSNKTKYVHREDLPVNLHKDYTPITNTNKNVIGHLKQINSYKKDQRKNSSEFPRRNSGELNVERNEALVKTAREELHIQNIKRNNIANGSGVGIENPSKRKRLGNTRTYIGNKFVSPMISNNDSSGDDSGKSQEFLEEVIDERLKNIDPKMVELIRSEIMDSGPSIDWCDIAGLDFAKSSIQEAVVWPMLRPDIFTGLRRPPKGILLFGPPGTGKTLIGKCVASQSQSTFFSISASSLTSKWIGDGEKMVRALFAVARCHQPAVIFIDEIDSLLQQRSETEHEASRRMKTEFLIQLDGATTDSNERLLLIGATNRPQELDEAARRRFVKRLYIPLPEFEARKQLVKSLMSKEKHSLTEQDLQKIAELSDGYSGADMKNLCCDASMGPIRSISLSQIQSIEAQEVRPVSVVDFTSSLNRVRPSVSTKDLDQYIVWNETYGSGMF